MVATGNNPESSERARRVGAAIGKWIGNAILGGVLWVLIAWCAAFYGAALLYGWELAKQWSAALLK